MMAVITESPVPFLHAHTQGFDCAVVDTILNADLPMDGPDRAQDIFTSLAEGNTEIHLWLERPSWLCGCGCGYLELCSK